MTVELNPVGVKCNIACSYCYEEPMRVAGNISVPLDLDKVFKTLKDYKQPFSLFGGEPLLTPLPVLEKIFKFGFDNFKSNSIQTNGTIITDRHIELFRKYNVHVGFSIDGRGDGNLPRTNVSTTRQIHSNFVRLLREIGNVSLIVTLTSYSVNDDLIPWLIDLDNGGLKSVRIHLLENDGPASLIPDEQKLHKLLRDLYQASKQFKNLQIDMFNDIKKLLLDPDSSVTCIWNSCDPYTTPAVQGIDGDGTLSNCGRVNKDGINWRKSNRKGRERTIMLYQVPQEHGGCQGCDFFYICKGQCPGTGIDKDWRNRSELCNTIKKMIAIVNEDVNSKLLQDPIKLRELESKIIGTLVSDDVHGDTPHGDKYEFTVPVRSA